MGDPGGRPGENVYCMGDPRGRPGENAYCTGDPRGRPGKKTYCMGDPRGRLGAKTKENTMATIIPERRPECHRVVAPNGEDYDNRKQLRRRKGRHTLCEEAHCPKIAECQDNKTATLLSLRSASTASS